MVGGPSYRVERLRQQIRDDFLGVLPEMPMPGSWLPWRWAISAPIPPEQWEVLTRTGVNHLMSISGLHVTMVSGLIFSLVYGLWRRSHQLALAAARAQSRRSSRRGGGAGLCAARGLRGARTATRSICLLR